MKHEAGGVLGEVKRKQTDATKAVELLKALRKLREARKQEAEVKGNRTLRYSVYRLRAAQATIIMKWPANYF